MTLEKKYVEFLVALSRGEYERDTNIYILNENVWKRIAKATARRLVQGLLNIINKGNEPLEKVPKTACFQHTEATSVAVRGKEVTKNDSTI